MPDVDLVVNCYERTYRDVLSPGFFGHLVADNQREFAGRVVVINNVDDPQDARKRAEALLADGEITEFVFVADRIDAALRVAGLPRRALGGRPYFLDFALVMATVGSSPYLLGWDAEVRLTEPADWVTPAVDLLESRPDVFSVAPRWPAREHDTLDEETVARQGPWHLGWAFSDQVWLVRREEVASPIYRRFAPASLARNHDHPFTFEARVESYQRAARRYRATHGSVRYHHEDLADRVVDRLGGTALEKVRSKALRGIHRGLLAAEASGPRWRLP